MTKTDSFTENIYQVINGYKDQGYRYISGEWTLDQQDRTFQSSGAGNKAPDTVRDAERILARLRGVVVEMGLPLQWLLDVRIQVSVFDTMECEYTHDTYAVVYIPYRVTIEGQGTFDQAGSAMGLQVVRISQSGGFMALNDKRAWEGGCTCPLADTGRIEHITECPYQTRIDQIRTARPNV